MSEGGDQARLERRLAREKAARQESERIAETAISDLYGSVVELRAASSLVTILQRVAVAANEATSFEDAVQVALSAVCEHTGWPIGHLYVTEEADRLRPAGVWHLDEPRRATNFVAVTEATYLSSGEGLPGRVLASGEPAWIEDVHRDDNFTRAKVAADIEVVAGFAFPVLMGPEVVGVLEFFAFEAIMTDEHLLSVIANVGAQLGRVIERDRAAEALTRNEQWTREILETANDAFISIDANGHVLDWNRQAERQFGWTREEAVGHTLGELIIPAAYSEAHSQGIQHFLGTGEGPVLGRRVELEALHRDGHQFPIELTPWVVQAEGSVRFNAFIHDITERKAFERTLEHQSLHDHLTGLPNRALLLDRLEHALDRARRTGVCLALLFVDLDRFKSVNDSFGHEAGDQVLLAVAERLPSVLRAGDTLARLSGDEFVVVCEDVDDGLDATEMAQRVLDELAKPFQVAGSEAYVSGSVGVAVSGGLNTDAETLLADADMAMYRAKERGRGVYEVFDTSLRSRVIERLTIERALRRGIEADELLAHYQPLVDVETGRVTGVEALVRWQHPERGLLAPGAFVPMAEDTALVGRISEWMLRESCRQMQAWRLEGVAGPDRVGVNLSVRDLEHGGLVDTIAGILDHVGLPPACLLLEITESAAMHDAQTVISSLWELRELGVRIAIDDFGTGFSSLDRLRRMPVESLKIDRSFIADMGVSSGGVALVAAIIAMSHSLGLKVVAEGVEKAEQLHELRRLGCDEVQGYLLGRPAPAAELDHVLRHGALGQVGPVG